MTYLICQLFIQGGSGTLKQDDKGISGASLLRANFAESVRAICQEIFHQKRDFEIFGAYIPV
jgi:hypothetical protein